MPWFGGKENIFAQLADSAKNKDFNTSFFYPQFGAAKSLQQLWGSATGEVTVTCGSKRFHVHKFLLQLQEGFFASALQEDKFKEGKTHHITIDSVDEDVIEGVLRYLYDLPYEHPDVGWAGYMHARMYAAADFYRYAKLKANAKALLLPCLENTKSLETNELLKVAQVIYEGTPDTDEAHEIRSKVARICQGHLQQLSDKGDFVEGICGIEGLAKHLLKLQHLSNDHSSSWMCRACFAKFTLAGLSRQPTHCPNCGFAGVYQVQTTRARGSR